MRPTKSLNNTRILEEEESLLSGPLPEQVASRQTRPCSFFSRYQKSAIVLKDVILLALAIPTLVTLGQHVADRARSTATQHSRQDTALPGCNCGTSVAQAVRLGCQYDTLAAAWLPPHCRDDELTALFDRSGDGPNGTWTYWSDVHHSTEIAVKDIGALADDPRHGRFYATYRWHMVHCFFYWRKAIRSQALGITLEDRFNTEKHAIHCSKMLDANRTIGAVSGVALNSNRWDP
ncbi:hypothetical protein A9K55_007810 [Cordyceps militaris]|uniref:Uncharacterized protein n=1 Tax=Cordyceps militaris TaxID=73501 RepID=A0A2H4SKC8_CORMI|nr:hypothetical protein A9K55_007810 [Cordyceps militaris]